MEREPDDLRSRLLAAAENLITTSGVGAVSLREVARTAGVSHAAPGHIFGDKRGLFTELATRCFDRFGEHLEQRSSSGTSGVERLTLAGVAYVEYAAAQWPLFEFMYRFDLIDVANPAHTEAATRSHRLLADAVQAAQNEGWCPTIDTTDLIRLCWALAHGLAAQLAILSPGTDPAHQMADIHRLITTQLAALGDHRTRTAAQ